MTTLPLNTIRESNSPYYVPRTIANVANSDATLAILLGPSVGTVKTIIYARMANWAHDTWRHWTPTTSRQGFSTYRPYCVIETRDIDKAEAFAFDFFRILGPVKTLNIAGHREESQPGIQAFGKELVMRLILADCVTEHICSGGQTGGDRGGWDGAIALDFPIGGMVPKGRRAEDGVIPDRYFTYGRCKHCKTNLEPGKALVSTLVGTPDWPGDTLCTMSPGGPGKLVAVWKCPRCGYSVRR